jgi:hypothetical protein
MSGNPINLACEALILFLHSIPLGSRFNVISFGSTFIKVFDQSVEYNEENLSIAKAKIESFKADLGGTEIYQPLQSIFDEKQD